jgi:hypothetical protein
LRPKNRKCSTTKFCFRQKGTNQSCDLMQAHLSFEIVHFSKQIVEFDDASMLHAFLIRKWNANSRDESGDKLP